MKSLIAAAAVACALTCVDANASTFDFSYTFTQGGTISGSLDGTLDGSFIDGVSNVHLTFDGAAYDQPLVTATYSATGTLDLGGAPVVSLDGTQNDFAFGNALSTQYFVFLGSNSAPGKAAGSSEVEVIGALGSGTDVPMNSSWQIQPVPLPAAAWLLTSGLGLLGAWGRRRASR